MGEVLLPSLAKRHGSPSQSRGSCKEQHHLLLLSHDNDMPSPPAKICICLRQERRRSCRRALCQSCIDQDANREPRPSF